MNGAYMDKKGTVYWITGLAGAGKTTIGLDLYSYLKRKKDNIVLLDGDILRDVYVDGGGYSTEARRSGAFQDARMCKMLSDQGIDVIYCGISMYEDCRRWCRDNIEKYKVIYLHVPMGVLIERDKKELYSKALKGEISEVVGIDLPWDEPNEPDVYIDNSGDLTKEKVVDVIIHSLELEND